MHKQDDALDISKTTDNIRLNDICRTHILVQSVR